MDLELPAFFNSELLNMPNKSLIELTKLEPTPYQLRRKSTQPNDLPAGHAVAMLQLPESIAERCKGMNYGTLCMISLQFIHGLRYADLMRIRNRDVSPDGFIRLHPAKGNNTRLLYYPAIIPIVSRSPADLDISVFWITYKQYWHTLRKVGLYAKLDQKRKKMVVSHLYRHNRLSLLKKDFDLAPDEMKNYSGHKSKRSLDFYIHDNQPDVLKRRSENV